MENDGHAAEQLRRPCLLERGTDDFELGQILASDVDEHVLRADRVRRDQAALEQLVRGRAA
jgi:hypothetical protein